MGMKLKDVNSGRKHHFGTVKAYKAGRVEGEVPAVPSNVPAPDGEEIVRELREIKSHNPGSHVPTGRRR